MLYFELFERIWMSQQTLKQTRSVPGTGQKKIDPIGRWSVLPTNGMTRLTNQVCSLDFLIISIEAGVHYFEWASSYKWSSRAFFVGKMTKLWLSMSFFWITNFPKQVYTPSLTHSVSYYVMAILIVYRIFWHLFALITEIFGH